MTAEVAILNKSAVALAADSTVSIGPAESPTSHKTYNTANKLFTLSKHRPVGMMIFGNAELMGIPWETIIKQYRSHLGKESFPTVEGYADGLRSYLEGSSQYFPDEQQRLQFQVAIYQSLRRARTRIDKAVAEAHAAGVDAAAAASEFAASACHRIGKQTLHRCVDEDFRERLKVEYADALAEAADGAFDKWECPAGVEKPALVNAAVHQLCSDKISDSRSGVVVAGFGESQYFPAVHAVSPQRVVLNRLIFSEEPGQCAQVSFDVEAVLIPFAQRDVVATFLQGINPDYVEMIESCLETVFDGLPGVLAAIGGLDDERGDAIKVALKEKTDSAKAEFFERLHKAIQDQQIDPLLDVIAMLPKDELAAMAEALVNLTSVKRKMSKGPETVGGPVDVAVISKGDGFIWISRKHYFRPDLNLQFTQSYLER